MDIEALADLVFGIDQHSAFSSGAKGHSGEAGNHGQAEGESLKKGGGLGSESNHIRFLLVQHFAVFVGCIMTSDASGSRAIQRTYFTVLNRFISLSPSGRHRDGRLRKISFHTLSRSAPRGYK
jgi:hypothetical protein